MSNEIKHNISGANGMAINRKTKKIYLTNAGEDDLLVLDEDTNLEKTIVGFKGMSEPKVAVNRTTNKVYVTSVNKLYVMYG